MSDAELIEAIKRILIDDKDWSADTLDAITSLLVDAGRLTWSDFK